MPVIMLQHIKKNCGIVPQFFRCQQRTFNRGLLQALQLLQVSE